MQNNIFENRIILFVGSGSPKKKFIFRKAKRLKVKIALLEKEKGWAQKYTDYFLEADPYNHEESLAKVREFLTTNKIDGAVTFWEDHVPLLGKICDTFGFTGDGYEVSLSCRDKSRLRKILEEKKYADFKYKLIEKGNLKEAMEYTGFPAVLKPVWGAMSQFVVKVENSEDAERAYKYIKNNLSSQFDPIYSYGKEIMMEEYIGGTEVDVDILVQDGEVKFHSITDNFPTKEPFFVETGDALPSTLPVYEQGMIYDMAKRGIEVLGIKNSCVHLEARLTPKGPKIVEVNKRMGGDYIYNWIKTVWEVDLIEETLKIALGIPILPKKREYPKVHLVGQYFIPEHSGVITGISGLKDIEHSENIHEIYISKKVGEAILVPPEGFDYLGWVVAKGNSYLEASKVASEAMQKVQISLARYQPTSAIGKTQRKSRFSEAIIARKEILRSAKIEKIRSVNISRKLKPLHIGVLCNRFEATDEEESLVNQDLTSVGENIQKALEAKGHRVTFFDMNENPLPFDKIANSNVDIIFNVCERINGSSLLEPHGAAILDSLQIPYTGSSPFTLALAIDKIKVKKLFEYHEIPTPRFDYVFNLGEEIDDSLKFPLIVKPANTDNSIGITNDSVVTNQEDLQKRIKYVLKELRKPALIEEFIEGEEIDVSVFGNEENIRVLPLKRSTFENMPEGVWHIFPFDAKWKDDNVYCKIKGEWSPPYPAALTRLISEIAIDAYNILDCHDYARIEMRIDKEGNPYVIEVNPNPSINRGDCTPYAAELIGISYDDFIEEIVRLAIDRYRRRPPYYHLQSFATFYENIK